ncbi:MAG: phosphoglycerate kinase [Chloroflexota bacterium]|nr:phosphoglycerate kinase [Chloroflexota bacterium]MDE2940889.1 phosphoglycerate kinase [Chloroflexota bacterium]MDE3268410.1 phosphoglycerate kinase [Chloroflexota bacterium]
MDKRTVRDIDVAGKRVLVRVDFNVEFDGGRISDDSRIRGALPTIEYLRERGAVVVLCSHLGRPGGKVVEEMRLAPVGERLSELLGADVTCVSDCVGPEVEAAVAAAKPGDVLLLENLRFHPEEEKNAPDFAKALASVAEIFVEDGFGVSHRAHASTEGVTRYLPSVAGFLVEAELAALGGLLESPARPLVAVLGGAKVSDKMGVLENFIERVDSLLIGGGMAATFLKAKGLPVGASLVEDDRLDLAREVMARAERGGARLVIPTDVVVADEFSAEAQSRTVDVEDVPDGWRIMDIGHKTLDTFRAEAANGKTILWNGPMGVFEMPAFSRGTREFAAALGSLEGVTTVLGGGSTAEVVHELGITDRITHVSTGGGASLEFLEGRTLPGVAALLDKEA